MRTNVSIHFKSFTKTRTLKIFIYLFYGSVMLSTYSCFTHQQFQTAKTLQSGEVSLGASVLVGSSSKLLSADDFDVNIPLGDVQVNTRFGLGKKQDIGLRYAAISQNLDLDYKFMLVGDHESKFVVSPGLTAGTTAFNFNSFPFKFGFLLHTSYDLTDRLSFFVTPAFHFDNSGFDFDPFLDSTISRIGGTAGIALNRAQWQFIFGAHYMTAIDGPVDLSISKLNNFTIGYGANYILNSKKEENKRNPTVI